MEEFSFFTAKMGNVSLFNHMAKTFPYQLNVIVDNLNEAIPYENVKKHKSYPSSLPTGWRAKRAKQNECLDYCKTKYMVWIDADVIVHKPLDFVKDLRSLDFLLAGFREPHLYHEPRLHCGFLVINTWHSKFKEYRKYWKKWHPAKTSGSDQKYLASFYKIFPYIFLPYQHLCFPTDKTDVSKQTLVHYTGSRRWLFKFLELKGKKGKKNRDSDTLEKDLAKFYKVMNWERP